MAENNLAEAQTLVESTLELKDLPKEAQDNLAKLQKLLGTEKKRAEGVLSGFRLDNQVALVTGGSRGIGLALAQALGEAGCKVAIASVNLNNAQKAAEQLREKGIEVLTLQVDVAKKDSVDKMVQDVINHWGDLHIAVNNAGVAIHSDGSEIFPEEKWDQLMGINLKGVFLSCQAEAKFMLKKGYGKIINLASISATISNRPQLQAAYNASKAGVVHLSKSLAAEWADRGVTVNSISPGYIDTDMTVGDHLVEIRKEWAKHVPMKRFGVVDDLQGITLLMASPLSNYMTGSDVIVDGGYVIW